MQNAKSAMLLACLGIASGCQTVSEMTPSRSFAGAKPVYQESVAPETAGKVEPKERVQQVGWDQLNFAGESTPEPVALQAPPELNLTGDAGSTLVVEPQTLRDAMELDASLQEVEEGQPISPASMPSPIVGGSQLAGTNPLGLLTLSSVESMALGAHPAIAEARARVAFSTGQAIQAGLPFNPVLQYQSDEIGNESSSGLHSVQLSQQFVTANKLEIAQQVQAHEAEKRRSELRMAELRVLTNVRTAFASALVAQRRAEIASQIVDLAEKSLDSVKDLLDAQEVSRVAWLQARVETEQARITAENAATELRASRKALAAATGLSALPEGALVGDIAEGLIETPWDSLLSDINATSPEISAAGSALERARWSLRLACAQVTPNITGLVGVGVDAVSDDTFARIGVSVPLPLWNRNQGNIRSARASISEASAAIERTQWSLEGRLANAAGRYQVALQRYRRLNANVLPISEETYQLSQRAFEAGETDYLQLLTVQRTLFNTRLSVLEAAAQARQAAAEIEGLLVTLDR
ncbi:Heavy metal RND efflux outer membrane protein, CzcC family [Rhodopirellula islandica]|uniref:Heavy metal RND efflux outer membrane protein, CzcC family n=1 Tax=Rhodopirellula islandica TaxID=595434 RepID=A0A0J1BG49_RHOIS|nr:TolC family protein [Rhodopirellula islandica]KLU05518.1 Heavy metal RND efflux outer membrane protein, CzcC family [Rhodopirellula islandica]